MNSSHKKQNRRLNKSSCGEDRSLEEAATVWGVLLTGALLWLIALFLFFTKDAQADMHEPSKQDIINLNECVHAAFNQLEHSAQGLTPVDKYNLLVDMVHGCVWAVHQFPDTPEYHVPEVPDKSTNEYDL